jgi:hypothetical protein
MVYPKMALRMGKTDENPLEFGVIIRYFDILFRQTQMECSHKLATSNDRERRSSGSKANV